MKALITLSARFDHTADGWIYPQNPALTYDLLFTRYLEVFEEVMVAARLAPLAGEPTCPQTSNGPGVSFVPLPTFSGVTDLVRMQPLLRRLLAKAISEADVYFLRVPDSLGILAWQEIRHRGLPYAVEVVGDPADSLKRGSVHHPLRPLIRLLAIQFLKAQCAGACAAAYVTEHTLQNRYPPSRAAFTTHYSSIELPGVRIRERPRYYSEPATSLIYVGTLEVFYKAPNVLVDALEVLADRGRRLDLTLVGDGRLRPELEARVKRQGLETQVTFRGKIPAMEVFTALDEAHLFVLPSLQEGLPKSMIEAMARGLPCIGSAAGGIPELLPPEDLVAPGDAISLADKIMEVAGDPGRLTRMSARNLTHAQKYRDDILRTRRNKFYRYVRDFSAKPKDKN
jgi:glycosyltransferase involved in cell wall biosynthesis